MPIRIGKWIKGIKLWSGIKRIFKGLNAEAKKLLPIAIEVVEKVKMVIASPVADVITALIPGDVDDIIKEKLRVILPRLIMELAMVEAITDIENDDERLNAILAKIKLSSDDAKNVFYHGLCSLIIEKLSDGNFSWSDAVIVSEYYYLHFGKQKEQQPATDPQSTNPKE